MVFTQLCLPGTARAACTGAVVVFAGRFEGNDLRKGCGAGGEKHQGFYLARKPQESKLWQVWGELGRRGAPGWCVREEIKALGSWCKVLGRGVEACRDP